MEALSLIDVFAENDFLLPRLAAMGMGHDAALFFACAATIAQQGSAGAMLSGSGVGSGAMLPRHNYASVRRENRELASRMRMRLTDPASGCF